MIDVSFYNAACDIFKGVIGDTVVIENVACKSFGAYYVMNGSKAQCSFNVGLPNIEYLSNVSIHSEVQLNLSTSKKNPYIVPSMDALVGQNVLQQFIASPTAVIVSLYECCPVFICKTSCIKLRMAICILVTSAKRITLHVQMVFVQTLKCQKMMLQRQ